jgi:tRNA G18 (ribose-2'-O)-methylase SpoU
MELMQKKREIFLILHNIRSAYNVGSIFRTADASGVLKIYLTGYTPAPIGRFGCQQKEIAKTALGAEKFVPWEKFANLSNLIKKLKKPGRNRKKVLIVGLEQSPKSIDYRKFKPRFPLAIILGNEVRGISKNTLKNCDKIIEIPMKGKKESLNVGVSAGIILFEIIK